MRRRSTRCSRLRRRLPRGELDDDDELPELVDSSSGEGDGEGDDGVWCLEHQHRGSLHAHVVAATHAPCRYGFLQLLVVAADTQAGDIWYRCARPCDVRHGLVCVTQHNVYAGSHGSTQHAAAAVMWVSEWTARNVTESCVKSA